MNYLPGLPSPLRISRLYPTRIEFQPYEADESLKIMLQRIGRALKNEGVPVSVLQQIASRENLRANVKNMCLMGPPLRAVGG